MTFRTMLLSAAMLVPLAFDSTPVVAQGRGQERAAVVTTQFQPQASAQGEAHRQDEAPPGLMRRFAAGLIEVLPAGIVRRFGNPEPAPAPEPVVEPEPTPEPEPEPEPVECVTVPTTVDGVFGFVDCNGNFTPAFPG